MGWLSTLAAPPVQALNPLDDRYYTSPAAYAISDAGLPITAETALKASAVWACVTLLSDVVAMAPLITYQRPAGGGKQRAYHHPLYDLLHDQPNRTLTAFDFVSGLMINLLLRGNAYAEILPGPRGAVDQLRPLHPDLVTPEQAEDGSRRFRVRNPRDTTSRIVLDEDMFNVMGYSLDGLQGVSVITYGANAIGLARATESHGARLFSQGTRLSGIVKYKGEMSNDAKRRFRASWQESYAGLGAAHGVAVLDEDMDWVATTMNANDAQFLETRAFQVEDIARLFRVPLHMIQHETKDSSWGSGIGQLSLGFLTFSVLPWMKRCEQAVRRDLITAPLRYFAEFLYEELLRADIKTRYDAYAVGRQWGWLSPDDILAKENMNPIGPEHGGDLYLAPVNMVPADQLRDVAARQAQPKGTPASSGTGPGAALEAFVYDAAARVVRRETAALSRLSKRTEGEPEAWRAGVQEFYAEHERFVVEALHLSADDAASYVAEQHLTLAEHGSPAVTQWEPGCVERLATLALAAAGGRSVVRQTPDAAGTDRR
jgi:HK97 family phage portal protein